MCMRVLVVTTVQFRNIKNLNVDILVIVVCRWRSNPNFASAIGASTPSNTPFSPPSAYLGYSLLPFRLVLTC